MRWRGIPPLTVRFAVASFLVLLGLGVGLQDVVHDRVRERAHDSAVRAAGLIGRAGIEPHLASWDRGGILSTQSSNKLDDLVAQGAQAGFLSGMTIIDGSGAVLYTYGDPRAMHVSEDSGGVAQSLRLGVPRLTGSRRVHRHGEPDRLLQVDVPVRVAQVSMPVSSSDAGNVVIARLHMPYASYADDVTADARVVLVAMGVALLLLWLALLHSVSLSGRRLRQQIAHNEHQAMHDALTGLPNRTQLFERMEETLEVAERDGRQVGVLLLDLDGFKEVNDTLGHNNGDRMLNVVAMRLRNALRGSDVLARLGGDEFGVLLPDIEDRCSAERVAQRLSAALEHPVEIDGHAVPVSASIGIATYPTNADSAELLLQRADVAMYAAKQDRSGVAHYSADSDHHSADRLALLADLHHALDRGELVPYFQPKANALTGELVGFEALLRWRHPSRGIVPPDAFIPLAEQTGLIRPMTLHVVAVALDACATWRSTGADLCVAVNVSVRNLVDTTFPDDVRRLLAQSPVPADRLVLEITETSLMADPDTALEVLRRLKELGVILSIDDYGSGYSSLAYIQRLPVDELKIDRRFVRHLVSDDKDHAIVRSTVDLGRNLGLVVVAEGVEDRDCWDQLVALQCDHVQGYFLSRPMPPEDVAGWLSSYEPRGLEATVR